MPIIVSDIVQSTNKSTYYSKVLYYCVPGLRLHSVNPLQCFNIIRSFICNVHCLINLIAFRFCSKYLKLLIKTYAIAPVCTEKMVLFFPDSLIQWGFVQQVAQPVITCDGSQVQLSHCVTLINDVSPPTICRVCFLSNATTVALLSLSFFSFVVFFFIK
jgi:hypothetical protein